MQRLHVCRIWGQNHNLHISVQSTVCTRILVSKWMIQILSFSLWVAIKFHSSLKVINRRTSLRAIKQVLLVEVQFEQGIVWPWSGHLSIYITVKPEGADFGGLATGSILFKVRSPGPMGQRISSVRMKFKAAIIPTPNREKRLLWDQFHSIKYPTAYIPRDNLRALPPAFKYYDIRHLHHILTGRGPLCKSKKKQQRKLC